MELNNQYKKNVFLGQHTRRYAVCQYPFIVEPLSSVFKQAPEALIAAINDRFHTQTYLMTIRSVQRPNEGLNMDSMKDLTTFTCIARTQRSILLPADIILKVRNKAANAFIYQPSESEKCLLLHVECWI